MRYILIIPILQMRERDLERLRNMLTFIIASKWQIQELNPGSLILEPMIFSSTPLPRGHLARGLQTISKEY